MTLNTKKVEDRIWTDTLELSLVSTAYFLKDKLGFSNSVAVTCLMNISEIATSIRDGYISMEDLKETMLKEYGFIIRKNTKGVMIETLKRKGEEVE